MNTFIARVVGLVAVVACLMAPAAALAQYRPMPAKDSEPDPGSGGKRGAYIKVGLSYWQGDIFSESSLTQWNVDLFGAEYALTSVNVEIDAYLGKGLIVPGFTLGYRKDDIRTRHAGHMLSAALFAGIDLKLLMIKAGGGAEWGVPAMTFDQTEFAYDADGTVRYRHTYPSRNAQVPVGVRSSGALYPFVVVSAVARPGPFLFEVGMRVNQIEFRFDDFEVRPGDQVTRAFAQRRVRMPLLFANVGIKFL
jgi:hypothetical protein